MVSDTGLEVVDVQVGGLRQLVQPSQPALHVHQLRLDGLQLLPLLLCRPVHLLVHHLHQRTDVGLGEHVLPNLPYDLLLKAPGVEPGGVAGAAAPLEEGLADIVGELPALGVLAGERPVARLAPNEPAEKIGAAHSSGVALPGCAGAQLPVHPAELGLGDDGGEGLLHPHGVRLVLGVDAPDQGSRVRLVFQDDVDAVLGPEPAGGVGYTLVVECPGDVQDSPASLGHPEDALHNGRGGRIGLEGGPLLGAVLHHDLAKAVGNPAGDPEAAGRCFPHAPDDFLGKIFAVKFVHRLYDALKQPAGCGVVGLLRDGHHADALAPKHRLEGDGVLPLTGEPGEFPYEDFLEGSLRLGGLVQHLLELGPVGDAPALGLVDVLVGDVVAVLLRVVPERPQLGCH